MKKQSVPRTPAAFGGDRDKLMMKLLHGLWFAAALTVDAFCLGFNGNYKRFVQEKFYQRNSFRFMVLMIVLVACLSLFLIFGTKGADKSKMAQAMLDQHPVAAYTMTACALLLIVYSFIFSTDLMGVLGILFFAAFWVMFYHVLFVLT